jgi:hypothetical protein
VIAIAAHPVQGYPTRLGAGSPHELIAQQGSVRRSSSIANTRVILTVTTDESLAV